MKISSLKGIGEKLEKAFYRAGVESVDDLLRYYPRNYDTYGEPVLISDLENDRVMAIRAEVCRNLEIKKIKNMVVVNACLRDEEGMTIKAVWFNSAYLKNTLKPGTVHVFRGLIRARGDALCLSQPKIYTKKQYSEKTGEMQPVYPLVFGLTNTVVSKAVRQALDCCGEQNDFLPEIIRERYGLCSRGQAIKNIHFPTNPDSMMQARKRLVFDEFFAFIYTLRLYKKDGTILKSIHKMSVPKEIENFVASLPYKLTDAQLNAWHEIVGDLGSDKVMNRLIQGDVGSGKTIVAILALFTAAFNGGQAALMAPTEVLAKQHYEEICDMIKENNFPFRAVFIAGSSTAKEKRDAYCSILEDDDVKIIVGTHAVFQEKVQYRNLTLVVTDEQHRFGVRQREAISSKGDNVHVMVMSATPIPRTLAVIMYGDLDISLIDELPANRLPIKNCVVGNEYRPNAYRFIEKQIESGRQAYVICPTVENSEAVEGENVIDYADKLRRIMPMSVNVAYLHGRMKPSEKNEIMEKFANNEIQILVSTTVVEVGVNVPNATVMMIENAERFGLAGLHQLRGRVGRGQHQSYCIFVNGSGKKESSKRLEILAKSNDGFYIAGEDLKLRGPGDFFGVRQSGDMEFRIGDVYADAKIIKLAAEAVDLVMEGKFSLDAHEIEILNEEIEKYTKSERDRINI